MERGYAETRIAERRRARRATSPALVIYYFKTWATSCSSRRSVCLEDHWYETGTKRLESITTWPPGNSPS